ncbi:MAG: DUF433 domain-containing protein [Anaerolineae bacterium]|nr:DUF433 domain-containing protein [Anaerolineae bacterium]
MTDQFLTPDLSKHIEQRYFGRRPHIRGRRVPVALIAYVRRDQALDIPAIMEAYTLTEAEVLAALLYYAENHAEIDAYAAASTDDWVTYGDDSFLLRRNDVPDRRTEAD